MKGSTVGMLLFLAMVFLLSMVFLGLILAGDLRDDQVRGIISVAALLGIAGLGIALRYSKK